MELTRRTFVAGAAAGAAIVASGALFGCSPEENTPSQVGGTATESVSYVAGTYSAAATGYGRVEVTVTFDESSITDIVVDASYEEEETGQAAVEELIEQVMEAQSADIDGVAGATLTSNAVSTAVAECIENAIEGVDMVGEEEEEAEDKAASTSGTYVAGTYTATATGIGEVTVTVTFDETSITACEVDASNETATIGGAAADTLEDQVLEAQSADIDGVSGATLTSTAVMTAVADCIAQATAAASDEAEEEAEEEEAEEAAASGSYVAGEYSAAALGYGFLKVTVTFDETSITDVYVDASNESEDIGQEAAAELEEQVLEAQSSDIEGVSGATLTSTAVKNAVINCIAQATAD